MKRLTNNQQQTQDIKIMSALNKIATEKEKKNN